MQYGFGIDVGGTTVKIGLFQADGTLLEKAEIPTRVENGGEAILPDIADFIRQCLCRHKIAPQEVLGIGIGVPGPVASDGTVNHCSNLNWGVFNLHETLGALTGFRVIGGNDANCAALGEYRRGSGIGCHSSLFVTLGTGIGGGIIVDGRILNGAHGVCGEIGHITVNAPERYPCTCGKCGCIEQYASANGIVRLANEGLQKSNTPSALRRLQTIACKDVFSAAQSGDAFAAELLETVFDYLGEALASACCTIDPECIILGGGVSRAGVYLLHGIEQHFIRHMFHACEGTQFVFATLGNDAGMIGAFHLLAM